LEREIATMRSYIYVVSLVNKMR